VTTKLRACFYESQCIIAEVSQRVNAKKTGARSECGLWSNVASLGDVLTIHGDQSRSAHRFSVFAN